MHLPETLANPAGTKTFQVGDRVQFINKNDLLLPYIARGCWTLDNELQPLYYGTPFGDFDQDINTQALRILSNIQSELYVTRACVAIYNCADDDTLNYCAVSVSHEPGNMSNQNNYIVFKDNIMLCEWPIGPTCDSDESP